MNQPDKELRAVKHSSLKSSQDADNSIGGDAILTTDSIGGDADNSIRVCWCNSIA